MLWLSLFYVMDTDRHFVYWLSELTFDKGFQKEVSAFELLGWGGGGGCTVGWHAKRVCLLVCLLVEPVCSISQCHISALNTLAGDFLPEGDHHNITKVSSIQTVIH